MKSSDKIILDPLCLINYASYYIVGLKQCFTNIPLIWDSSKFQYTINGSEDYRHGLGIILDINNKIKKIYIDFHDSNHIMQKQYDWCDVYGKINLRSEDLHRSKIIPIGPNFGVRFTNIADTLHLMIKNYLSMTERGWKPGFLSYVQSYIYPFYRRKNLDKYLVSPKEDKDYIFALSTLWYDEKTDISTNMFRANYSRLCKKLMPSFEGGLFMIDDPAQTKSFPKYEEYRKIYSDLITEKRIPMKEYIDKTAKSAFVFNTPSVQGCHGWKLGEYLAMGKAIISTPLENVMPGNFREGHEYICVKSNEELEQAIIYLRDHPEERLKLKSNAKQYFDTYLRPDIIIKRLTEHNIL